MSRSMHEEHIITEYYRSRDNETFPAPIYTLYNAEESKLKRPRKIIRSLSIASRYISFSYIIAGDFLD